MVSRQPAGHPSPPCPSPSHTEMSIPVSQPCLSLRERQLVLDTLDCNQLTNGPACRKFESELAAYLDTPYCVVTSSGTTALHLALAALDIGPGDEVIVPDLTFVATGNAVHYVGATPVLCDISPVNWCIDPVQVASLITHRTRAVLIVHLYGASCDMAALMSAIPDNIPIIEDAAEGFGGYYSTGPFTGARLGSRSLLSTFSFYGNKVITTGEGGAVTTDSPKLNDQLRHLRGQAMSPVYRYYHNEVGYNYRLTDIAASIGLGQLSHVEAMLTARRDIIRQYANQLDFHAPCTAATAAPWLYTALLDTPYACAAVAHALSLVEVETRPCFVPLHRMPMFGARPDAHFPHASHIADCAISLPTYPDLPLSVVDSICDCIKGVTDE